MEEENELEKKSFKLNGDEFSVILQSVFQLNDYKVLRSTDKVKQWNDTAISLENQGLECGWLTKEPEPEPEQSGENDKPIEAEVVEK